MEQQWALVTGASRGLGYAMADCLASKSYNIAMIARGDEELFDAQAKLSKKYPEVRFIAKSMDLSGADAAEKAYAWVKEQGIRISFLVNNAGIYVYQPLTTTPAALQNEIINLDITALTSLCRLFGADMIEDVEASRKKFGSKRKALKCYILNVASYSVYMPIAELGLYAGCKAYVKTFSRCLQREFRSKGVYVTAVAPAGIDTTLMGLRPSIQKLAVRLGFLASPRSVARKSIRATLCRRPYHIPGWYNALFIPFLSLAQPIFSKVLK